MAGVLVRADGANEGWGSASQLTHLTAVGRLSFQPGRLFLRAIHDMVSCEPVTHRRERETET